MKPTKNSKAIELQEEQLFLVYMFRP